MATELHALLDAAATRWPERTALEAASGSSMTYAELAALSDRVRDRLRHLGVVPHDRVGICLRKSIDAVAAIFGVLKTGAAYVPQDVSAPASRTAFILHDCGARVVIVERPWAEPLRTEMALLGECPAMLIVETGDDGALQAAIDRDAPSTTATATCDPDDLAYILYTSGSTGHPKGVMLSHRNALSFIDWCSAVFAPTPDDCFSSHAPFHFDLSIFDLYVPLKHGAKLVLIDEPLGKDPARLAALIAARRISVWYSVPSVLTLLVEYGRLERHDYPTLRLILFAGEVFSLKHLRRLSSVLSQPRYFNLYGPTETNVCTFYELPAQVPPERSVPFPIGQTCSHLHTLVVDAAGQPVSPGTEGELCVSGPAVMQGYWNAPDLTARAFFESATMPGHWYRTGDIVEEDSDGNYVFRGRRDRMVKRRGYRVELGEVEAGLLRHPAVREAAAVALPSDDGVRIKVVLSCAPDLRPSIIELKRFCADVLPAYMIPDLFVFRPSLPKTATGKVDYQQLAEPETR